MGIMYVNPARRGKKRFRVSGRAKVGRSKARRSKKRRMPAGLAAYWKKRRSKKSGRKNPARKKARRGGLKKKRKAPAMARRKKRRARRGKKRVKRKSRRKGRKRGRGGKRRVKRRKARRNPAKRRRKGRRGKRRTKRRSKRKGRKRAKRRSPRRKKRRTSKSARARRLVKQYRAHIKRGGTIIMPNPRRRRRKRRSTRRRSRRRGRRRAVRRYRRNPGSSWGGGVKGMFRGILGLAKKAAPVLIGFYATRLLVSKLGPRVPGLDRLGMFQGPVLAIGGVAVTHFATRRGPLAKYRASALLGAGLNMIDALISAFAPASVKAMIGVGDVYDRALGEYLNAGGGAPAEDPSLAMGEYVQMGEYVAVGGVEEELGVDEELGGVEEELGDQGSWGEGVSQGAMLRPVERQAMLAPVPTRSYTRGVDNANAAWNQPRDFYQGIFAGGAKGSTWDPGS
jgi:hypothetical protein